MMRHWATVPSDDGVERPQADDLSIHLLTVLMDHSVDGTA
jgi:hypothetical protein